MGNAKTKYTVCLYNITAFEKVTYDGKISASNVQLWAKKHFNLSLAPPGWKPSDNIIALMYWQGGVSGWAVSGDTLVRQIFAKAGDDIEFQAVELVTDGKYDKRYLQHFIARKCVTSK